MIGLFKPKWQHTDPAVRRQAIPSITDESVLITIIRQDDDLAVKKQVITQLTDVSTLLDLRTEPGLKSDIDKRLTFLVRDQAGELSFSPAMGDFLSELEDADLISHLTSVNQDEQLQMSLLNQNSDVSLLVAACSQANSSATRLKAATLLKDEVPIRSAMKGLGKKDKTISRLLRDKLGVIKHQQEQRLLLEAITSQLNDLGNSDSWKQDQARLDLSMKKWTNNNSVATSEHKQQWQTNLASAVARIAEQKKLADSMQPVAESKQTLLALAEKFSESLNDKLYLPASDANDFIQTLDSFSAEWKDMPVLKPAAEEELAVPFTALMNKSRERIRELGNNARTSKHFEKILDKATSFLNKKVIPENCVETLKQEWQKKPLPKDSNLTEKLTSDLNTRLDKLRQRITTQYNTRSEGLDKIDTWINTLQADLENDNISSAGKLYSKIENTLAELPEVPANKKKNIQHILLDCRPKLKHLEGWRHWGTDKARETLIDDATALAEAKISVKERVKKLKELRERWKKLGKIDPKSAQILWQQFDAACNKAFEPVSEDRKRDNAQRDDNLKTRQDICQQLETLETDTDWKQPQWREIDKGIGQLRNQWRSTGPVRHNRWNKINKRFNDAIEKLNVHLENERRISFNRRSSLIEQMQAIKADQELGEALELAKKLQKQWQPTVLSRRSEEQTLWKQFRAAADIVFDRAKQQRKETSRESSELLKAKEEICIELESILKLSDDELSSAQGQCAKLETQWEELGDSRERRYQNSVRRYEKALSKIKAALDNRVLSQTRQRLKTLLKGDADRKADSADTELLNVYLLEIEILLEIDSPDDQSDNRMRLQVERLADNMGRSQPESQTQEIMALAEKVCGQINVGSRIDGLDSRIKHILENDQKL